MSNDAENTKDNNISKGDNSNEKSREERINTIINELKDLINDIRDSTQINDAVVQSQAPNDTVDVNTTIVQTAQALAAINSIKTELCRLPLDFCEKEYIDNCVTPLETTMEFIATTSFELATSVSILTTSPIVPRKKGELKDTIHTIYSMNDEVEDIYKVLKKRLKKLTQGDNCCKFL